MSEKSLFFDSIDGDRKYNSSDFTTYFKNVLTNGVFPSPSSNLQVISNGNLTITIKEGGANINGYLYSLSNDKVLTISTPNPTTNRTDTVVVRWDLTERKMEVVIKENTTLLERSNTIYEIALAEILVSKGTASITQDNIKDTRQDTSKCGLINSLIQADTTTLFAEYNEGFTNWFNDIKEKLSENPVGELQLQINAFKGLLGQANGIASLDENCKIPVSNIPNNFSTIYSAGYVYGQCKLTIENLDFKKYKEVEIILDLRGGYYSSELIVVKMNDIEVISIPKTASGAENNYMKARMIVDNSGNLRLGYFYNKDSSDVDSYDLISLFLLTNKILKLDTSTLYDIDITAEQINNVEIIGRL